ncbi:MAG: DUF2232 domain-containing protein [Ruminococcaceae bacterium]|nr:DUF2232 domain-containing protein [Oscillospiraceae bacterium]
MQTKELTKGALLAALTALFALSFIYLPLFSVFGMFLGVCTVAVLLTYVQSVKISVVALVVSMILTAMFSNLQTMLFSGFLMIVLPGTAIGVCFRKQTSFAVMIIVGSMAYLFAMIGTFMLSKWLYGMDLIAEFQTILEQTMKEWISVMESVPELADSKGADEMLRLLPSLMNTMTMMIPSAFLLASGILSLGCVLLSRSVLCRLKQSFSYLPSFSQIHVSKTFAYGYLILMVAQILLAQNSSVYFMLYNVSALLSGVLFIGGLSLIKYFINKTKMPKGVSLLVFCIILPFVFLLFQIISLVGMIDALWDFRTPKSFQ